MAHDPAALWLVRHGQSLGNVARDAAHRADLEVLDLADRDMDVPLSSLGCDQAIALGRWLSDQPKERWPEVVLSSPYERATQTAEIVLAAAGLDDVRVHLDERLRERELGVLDLLTRRGVEQRHPEEAKRRARLGKFYHRPPGGESWVDVALRLRSFRDSMALLYEGKRLMVVSHEVVIVMMRYLIDNLTEAQALALSHDAPLANCSLTTYETDESGELTLDLAGWTTPLEEQGAAVTEAHDAPVAAR
jgi:2,3-bisphosphoglycerate-dependent phosphoglycerate mutase